MRANLFYGLAVGLLTIFFSCSKQENNSVIDRESSNLKIGKEAIISASFEKASEYATKTGLDSDRKVFWTPGDEIKVFSAGESAKFTSLNTENSSTAIFKGVISFLTGDIDESNPDSYLYSLYPYDATASVSEGVISTSIPSCQVGYAGSFGDNLALAVAKSSTFDLAFKNAYSGLDFEFSEEGYTTIKFETNNGEFVAGSVNISFGQNGTPVTTVVSSGSSSITLLAPDGGTFETGKRYFIICAPQALTGGFTLTAHKATGDAVFTVSSAITFERNRFKSITGNLNERAVFQNTNITFADNNVKTLCVSNWDTNGDGELSYLEATAVTNLGSVFQGTSIVSFDELQHFVGLTEIGANSFQGCAGLTSIVIPGTVTTIGDNAFDSCSSLNSITIPSAVTTIGSRAFYSCSNLFSLSVSPNTPPVLGTNALNTGSPIVIHVPDEAGNTYISAAGWSSYSTSIFYGTPEYVDMGLSVKWATCNVKASAPEGTGAFYAWGSFAPQTNGSKTDKTYYYGGSESEIPAENDIAYLAYGGTWRIPSKTEWQELADNTTCEYSTLNGKRGYMVTSRINGATIFLPLDYSVNTSSTTGSYWTSDKYADKSARFCVISESSRITFSWQNRYQCYMIRPVME